MIAASAKIVQQTRGKVIRQHGRVRTVGGCGPTTDRCVCSLPTIKSGAVSVLTPCSVWCNPLISLPNTVVPKYLFNKTTPEVNQPEPLTTFRYQNSFMS
jgi:hypothetical protein